MVPYSDGVTVGAMIMHTTHRLQAEPELLSSQGVFWDGVHVEKVVNERAMWTRNLKDWACQIVDPEEEFGDKFVRESAHVKHLRSGFLMLSHMCIGDDVHAHVCN